MTKPDPSALVAAAIAFDAELATYARLGDLYLRAPTTTLKHLEILDGSEGGSQPIQRGVASVAGEAAAPGMR